MTEDQARAQFANYYRDSIDFSCGDNNPFTAMNTGADCCVDKHQTFYGAIMNSPQWKAWYKEMQERLCKVGQDGLIVFDIDECESCGIISDRHLQEFFKFVRYDE